MPRAGRGEYQRLGTLQIVGQPDSTTGYQFNPNLPGTGWDVLISASTALQQGTVISGTWPYGTSFQVYQIYLDGPVGSSAQFLINRQPWNFISKAYQNSYDPQQVPDFASGDELAFAWTVAATAPPYTITGGANVRPIVTMWWRSRDD